MPSSSDRLQIYNMALGYCGCRTVGSPNEKAPEAIQCELFWDRARRSALRDFPWRFATKRVMLQPKALPEAYEGDWTFCYALPDGVLRVKRLLPASGRTTGARAPYELEAGDEGQILLCNVPEARAVCIVDVENVALWDEAFVSAMARKLAALIAVPLLKNNPNKVQETARLYQEAISAAEGMDAAEERGRQEPDSWLDARG